MCASWNCGKRVKHWNNKKGVSMKVLDFSGSNETLIRMFEHDIIAPELKKLDRAVKVAMIILVEEEPFYVPDSDDITITKTGEDIRPQVNLGEPCQIEDDLHWDEHHEARMDVIGQNGGTGEHYTAQQWIRDCITDGDEHDSEVVGV